MDSTSAILYTLLLSNPSLPRRLHVRETCQRANIRRNGTVQLITGNINLPDDQNGEDCTISGRIFHNTIAKSRVKQPPGSNAPSLNSPLTGHTRAKTNIRTSDLSTLQLSSGRRRLDDLRTTPTTCSHAVRQCVDKESRENEKCTVSVTRNYIQPQAQNCRHHQSSPTSVTCFTLTIMHSLTRAFSSC